MRKISLLALALETLIVCLIPTPVSAASIGLTRFGGCLTPPGGCTLTINDNDPLHDFNPALGVIQFSEQIGQFPDGIFSASGTLIETIVTDGTGRVTGLGLVLTNALVLGTVGGIGAPPHILGQIAVVSNVPIVSLGGVAGGVGLGGSYLGTTGNIGFADIRAEGRVGGAFLAAVDPLPASGVPSPVPFGGVAFGAINLPVAAPLIGTLNFELAAGDAFFLPASADFSVAEIPEISTFLLLGSGLLVLGGVKRKTRRKQRG